MKDPVNNPSHYQVGGYKVIDIIEAFGLNFRLGNAVKYILRAGRKDAAKTAEDLRKAVFYLNREADRLEAYVPCEADEEPDAGGPEYCPTVKSGVQYDRRTDSDVPFMGTSDMDGLLELAREIRNQKRVLGYDVYPLTSTLEQDTVPALTLEQHDADFQRDRELDTSAQYLDVVPYGECDEQGCGTCSYQAGDR